MSLTDAALQRLLDRGERALLSGNSRTLRESFKSMESSYWRQSLDERDHMHLRMRAAEKIGAVRLEWALQGGDDRPLNAVVLTDLDKLAAHIGRSTASALVTNAEKVLAAWRHHERIEQLLTAWRNLKKVRMLGPESAGDFADALRVLDSMQDAGEDRVVRQLSVELFRDSKRIEALRKHLDVLTAEALNAPARHWSEVFGSIGITKEPQPFLVAGTGILQLTGGIDCPIIRPFIGVASTAVQGYAGPLSWLLSIENLTTFHLAALSLTDTAQGLVIYTAGMPSPSWSRTYARILTSLPESTVVYHWGDHDEGGFRIAARLGQLAKMEGRTLTPWLMDASQWPDDGDAATTEQQRAMSRNAEAAGWVELASRIPAVLFEQEGLAVRLPS